VIVVDESGEILTRDGRSEVLNLGVSAFKVIFFLKNMTSPILSFYLKFYSSLSKSGVSDSNSSEGHIPNKKRSAGRNLVEKSFCGPQFTKKPSE
jgi:hypothetical protein